MRFEQLKEIDYRAYRVIHEYVWDELYLLAGYMGIKAFPTQRELLEYMLADAQSNYRFYSRRCPGRDQAEDNIAKYTALLAKEDA